MSYKNIPALPSNVEIVKRFDTREIDGATPSLALFQKNPTRDVTQRNYVSNPFQGNTHHIVLDLSVNLTSQFILGDQAGNVKPVEIMNALKDATVHIETNGGRTERILEPLSSYMNFSQTRGNVDITNDGATAPSVLQREMAVIQATGPRKVPDLFYLSKNESFTFDIEFNDGSNFPAAADYTPGRLALQAQFTLAQVSDKQLEQYKNHFRRANN